MKKRNLFITSCVALAFAGSASAANVIWDIPQTVSAATDVNTQGNLEYAKAFGPSSSTVNGVIFDNAPSYTDNFQFTFTGFMGGQTFIGTNDTEGQAYATLLDSGRYFQAGSTTASFTLSNLTVGQEYLIQFFVADFRTFPNDRSETITGGLNTSAALQYLDGDNSNGGIHASFVTGSFTADAVSQAFSLTANEDVLINAVQLRNIPEPSAALLGGLAALAFLRRRRA